MFMLCKGYLKFHQKWTYLVNVVLNKGGVAQPSWKAHKIQALATIKEIYKTKTINLPIIEHIYFTDFVILAKAEQKRQTNKALIFNWMQWKLNY